MQNRNFNDLYAFTQVVKLGNFSRAAQSLGVQPSALSHRMNDLENRLNTKLLNRTTRSMSPTEVGSGCMSGLRRCLAAFRTSWRRLTIWATRCGAGCASMRRRTPPIT
ncbi:helix-turn-helix domain-containing protein [Haemophilus haemolyticus]|uniref:LysR family transcriptional regulator n=1 Tax=Haemophilus haemolyticus TaxID=726 RepID=UPI001864FDAE